MSDLEFWIRKLREHPMAGAWVYHTSAKGDGGGESIGIAGATTEEIKRFDRWCNTLEPILRGIGVAIDDKGRTATGRLLKWCLEVIPPERHRNFDELHDVGAALADTIELQLARSHTGTNLKFLENRVYQPGKGKTIAVTENEDNVLQAFLATPAMDGPTLIAKSGVEHALRILRQLKEKYDRRLAPYICFPGAKGKGGYSVRITK